MKEIKTTNGFTAYVDDEDYDRLVVHRWYGARAGNTVYAIRSGKNPRRTVYMHREIMGLDVGAHGEVDHANRNGLDNTRANLRVGTHSQNIHNSVMPKSKTGFKGVHKQHGTYYAAIRQHQKTFKHFGHKTPESAARAYDKMAIQRFGDFARTNFPRSEYDANGEVVSAR